MSTLEKGTGYALTREQLIADNPRLLEVRETWADRSGGPDECHPCCGMKDRDGYGRRKIRYQDRHITVSVSRLQIALIRGYITANEQVAHRCHDPSCLNPRHLVAVLRSEHNKYDAEPKRLKRMAKQFNGNVSFSVWFFTNDDLIRVDWDAETRKARLLAGYLARKLELSWYEAHRVAARHTDLPETPEFNECIEAFYRNILVEPEISTASFGYAS